MSKEEWVHSYECAIENISDELDIDMDEAELILNERLEKNPSYLDGYITFDMDCYS